LHAAKLAGMQDERATVAQAKHATRTHVWSEMMPEGRRQDGRPILHGEDVIMDGWCKENLAILREDGQFARLDNDGKGDHLSHAYFLDHQSGPEALARVNHFKAQIEGSRDLQDTFHTMHKQLVDAGIELSGAALWDAQSVFHADFRQQAGKVLHRDRTAPEVGAGGQGDGSVANRFTQQTLLDMQAVDVARSLGANIRSAIAEAPAILASAREMFPRP
jgi:hypothetical protein